MRLRGFVPIEELDAAAQVPRDGERRSGQRSNGVQPSVASPPPALADNVVTIDDWERRVSLFGEAEG
jgi:hypothetical protein